MKTSAAIILTIIVILGAYVLKPEIPADCVGIGCEVGD